MASKQTETETCEMATNRFCTKDELSDLALIVEDDNLLTVLLLAEEYQVDHVRNKCRQFIQKELRTIYSLTTDKLLVYLHLCDLCNFQEEREQLKDRVVSQSPKVIALHPLYGQVDKRLMLDIMYAIAVKGYETATEYKACSACASRTRYTNFENDQLSRRLNAKDLEVRQLSSRLTDKEVEFTQLRFKLERQDALIQKISLLVDGSIVALILYFIGHVSFSEIVATLW